MKKLIDERWEIFKSFEPEWYKDKDIMKAFFRDMGRKILENNNKNKKEE